MNLTAYLRVSTEEQASSGLGLDAQRERIGAEAGRRDWSIVRYATDEGQSAKSLSRPQLTRALLELGKPKGRRDCDGLVVAKIDRLSRSVLDLSKLMRDALRQDWALVILEPAVDMTTPYGRAMAQMAMVFAELERELISERTKDALAQAKARGVVLGRRPVMPLEIEQRVLDLKAEGKGRRATARILNAEGYLNTEGRPFQSGSIADLLRRLEKQAA